VGATAHGQDGLREGREGGKEGGVSVFSRERKGGREGEVSVRLGLAPAEFVIHFTRVGATVHGQNSLRKGREGGSVTVLGVLMEGREGRREG